MASVTLTFTTKALPDIQELDTRVYRAWQLYGSVTDAYETNGVDNDPNVFVMRTKRWAGGDREVFSHVASLYEMNNLPESKADIPPKTVSMYRSSLLKLDFQNTIDLEAASADIKIDVDLLMRAASNGETQSDTVIGYDVTPDGELNTIYYGVSSKDFSGLVQLDVDAWSYDVIPGEARGHSGTLSPGAVETEYIYVMYPADRGECTVFSLGGFSTTPWEFEVRVFNDQETGEDETFYLYRTHNKLGVSPGEITYAIS